MCCANLCLSDRRRVTVGCSGAVLRIWSLEYMIHFNDDFISSDGIETDDEGGGGKGAKDNSGNPWITPHESVTILLDHKGGLTILTSIGKGMGGHCSVPGEMALCGFRIA